MPTFTTFNPADVLNVTLSNGNLTATTNNFQSGTRAVAGLNAGKHYFEFTVSTWTQNQTAVGISPLAESLNSGPGGSLSSGLGRGGAINVAGANPGGAALGVRSSGDTIGVAVDLDGKLVWYRVAPSGNWNGSGTANPATGTGGASISVLASTLYPCYYGHVTGEACTVNLGASGFSGATPSGFTAGWFIADPVLPSLPVYSYGGGGGGASRGRMLRKRKKGDDDDSDVDELLKPDVASMRIGRQRYD